MNEELVASAVLFLKDPNVLGSPLNKKIEFLQTKGLNEQEIEEALSRASTSASSSVATSSATTQSSSAVSPTGSYLQAPPLDYYGFQPQLPERTWKDYFIMATATAGVTYGLYQVVTRYLLPNIIPPGQTKVDEDKAQIDEEFVKIDKILEQMAAEQQEIKEVNGAKLKEIDVVIDNINDFLAKYTKDKLKFDDDLRLMKLEVDNLQNSVEKNTRITRDNIKDELKDIVEELASLRNLVKARLEASANSERKVAPVSSIPSASEILMKAKAAGAAGQAHKKTESVKVAQKDLPATLPATLPTTLVAAPTPANSVTGPSFSAATDSPNTSSSSGMPTAEALLGGIPDWQLQHKKQEEEREKNQDLWQNAQSQQEDDEKVQKSIENVGVPSWQLNAS